jgi:nicotinamidase/pyrazinamidase
VRRVASGVDRLTKETEMKRAAIVVLIDIQNGFARSDLTEAQGGSLYVPGGEAVGAAAAQLIARARDTVFVLSQDFHPAGHISFASTHGVTPFSLLRLRRDAQGRYQAGADGELEQTAWLDHCVQGTQSALFVDAIMAVLPPALADALRRHVLDPVLTASDERGNTFHVVRKGMRADLDSYGIATENDRASKTAAPGLFAEIAATLRQHGVSHASVAIGGLATNFCVEFSHGDLCDYLLPALRRETIEAEPLLLTDLCAGIDLATPDGTWPDLAAAVGRMTRLGTRAATVAELAAVAAG